jgi:hypothetical protein
MLAVKINLVYRLYHLHNKENNMNATQAKRATQQAVMQPAAAPMGQEKPAPATAKAVATVKPKAAVLAAKPAITKQMVVKAKPVASGKSAAAAKPAQAVKAQAKSAAVVPAEKGKAKKVKLVRDSYTMPETEHAVLGQVKKACLKAGVEIKKSELLRIGVALLRGLNIASLKGELAALTQLKSGRPVKEK